MTMNAEGLSIEAAGAQGPPVSRVALITMLHGCERVLETINPATGAIWTKVAYVHGLVARIKDAIAREPKVGEVVDGKTFAEFRRDNTRVELRVEGGAFLSDLATGVCVSIDPEVLESINHQRRNVGAVEARVVSEFASHADVEVKP